MKTFVAIIFVTLSFTAFSSAQTKRKPKPRPTPAKAAPTVDKGTVLGRTYTNKAFKFEVTFPDTWLIPGDDFEAYMKEKGFDLALKAPDSLPPVSKAKVDKAIKNVQILLTAYRSMPGETDNAIVRISVENLVLNPQIKDAVDYIDAIRATFALLRTNADFLYSETQAEKLGTMQFAYLDTSTNAGKKRMYATVRDGYAVMFTISYSKDADLQTLRGVLEQGNFRLK